MPQLSTPKYTAVTLHATIFLSVQQVDWNTPQNQRDRPINSNKWNIDHVMIRKTYRRYNRKYSVQLCRTLTTVCLEVYLPLRVTKLQVTIETASLEGWAYASFGEVESWLELQKPMLN